MMNSQNAFGTELSELLNEDGEEFVEAAYRALLKRRPDSIGGPACLKDMKNGSSKLQILHEISVSDECRIAGGMVDGLTEAHAEERLIEKTRNGRPTAPPEILKISHADQLLVIDDHRQLIKAGYWLLLGRAPDALGETNYLGRLNDGISKTQFLFELSTSTEGRERRAELQGLREAFVREGFADANEIAPILQEPHVRVAPDLQELLELHGGSFVECAFITLLRRPPDNDEYRVRLAQLIRGDAKVHILAEITDPNAAPGTRGRLLGLSAAISQYDLACLPLLGRVLNFFFNAETNSRVERRARAAEQRLTIMEAENKRILDGLSNRFDDVAASEMRSIRETQLLRAQILSLEKSVALLRRLIEESKVTANCEIAAPKNADKAASIDSLGINLRLRGVEISRDLKRILS